MFVPDFVPDIVVCTPLTGFSAELQNQDHMGTSGKRCPSVARSLSDSERIDLAASASALPDDWVVVIEPPYGQLAITPRKGSMRFHRSWVAHGASSRIFHDNGRVST
jgi:hypothetical protein